MSSNFSSTPHPTPFPPGKTFVFRDWQWGICHCTHYDIFYICSKKLGLNYTGELLKTALNAIIIYCISNSLQQLITLLNLVFFLIPPSLKLILPAMNKQGQLHWVPIGKESLDSREEFDWQLWDQASLSSGEEVSHLKYEHLFSKVLPEFSKSQVSPCWSPPYSVCCHLWLIKGLQCHGCCSPPNLTSHSPVSPPRMQSSAGLTVPPGPGFDLWAFLPKGHFTWNPTSTLISLANTFSFQTQLRKYLIWKASPMRNPSVSPLLPWNLALNVDCSSWHTVLSLYVYISVSCHTELHESKLFKFPVWGLLQVSALETKKSQTWK